jgi:hypothetical protein
MVPVTPEDKDEQISHRSPQKQSLTQIEKNLKTSADLKSPNKKKKRTPNEEV